MDHKPKIVVLDGHPLNPGDLSWDPVRALGELIIYPRSSREEVIDRSANADILIVNKVPIDRDVLESLPELRYIGVTATGYNNLEMDAISEFSILASNIPDYGSFSVAQHAMALLLAITNRVSPHFNDIKVGKWMASGDFCFTSGPLMELAEKTMGLIGLGKIGQKMGVMAESMGMFVSYHTRSPKQNSWEYHKNLHTLLSTSDVISLHVPLSDATYELINSQTLSLMKKSAILLNTSRGALINENDLHEALENDQIAAAGLDVLSQEPPPSDHILLHTKNCLITPHNAWASRESRQRIMNILTENLQSFLDGEPINTI